MFGLFPARGVGKSQFVRVRLIVLARRPGCRDLRVPGRFVVLVEESFMYYMLRCVFWVVSGLVLLWVMA